MHYRIEGDREVRPRGQHSQLMVLFPLQIGGDLRRADTTITVAFYQHEVADIVMRLKAEGFLTQRSADSWVPNELVGVNPATWEDEQVLLVFVVTSAVKCRPELDELLRKGAARVWPEHGFTYNAYEVHLGFPTAFNRKEEPEAVGAMRAG